jgi:hypothetical protein
MGFFDDRGQALQVGAILLFGILIVALSLYQATVVPNQNERVEFESYLDANSDMEQLDSEIGAAAARDHSTRTAVTTGVNYPTRTVFVNPGPAGTRLRTGSTDTIRIENVTAVNGEEGNTMAKWNGTPHEYNTTTVRFDTNYNQLQAPPIVYESGVIHRPPGDTGADQSVVVSDGSLVENDRITIVTLAGDLDAGGLQPTVVARPVSAHSRTVVITGNDSENITLTLPSELSNDTWESEVLSEEIDGGSVLDVTQNGTETVDVVLNGSRTYELRLARVELRRQSDSSTVAPTEPEYVVRTAGDNQSINANQSVRLTAEVRDRYNNPKRGADIEFSTANGTFAQNDGSSRTVTTGGDGHASVQFSPYDNQTGELEVDARVLDPNARTELNTTTFTVNVGQGAGGGGGDDETGTDEINPAQGDLVLTSATKGDKKNEADLKFSIRSDKSVTKIRVPFYFSGGTGGSNKDAEAVETFAGSGFTTGQNIKLGDPITELNSPVEFNSADGSKSVTVTFTPNKVQTRGDFFILVMEFSDGSRSTYFVAPQQ